jgi:hypothetical protein
MYGLVNKAVYQLVVSNYGRENWEKIRNKAGLHDDDFISMESYPDELTYRLVQASSDVLALTPEQVLEAFGEYWITYTAKEGYGNLLDMAGTSLTEFLNNLDQLHSCVGHVMPRLNPPSFHCSDVQNNSLKLHHYSSRRGLEHMVIGLIKGLGKKFNSVCSITLEQSTSQGADHNVFFIQWS